MDVGGKVEKLINNNKVFIFSKSYCPYCNKVKSLFDSLDVGYEALELDRIGDEGVAIQQFLHEKTKQKTVPSVFISGKHIGGCDATMKTYESGDMETLLNVKFEKYDYDMIVVGGGSGGIAAAKEASKYGKKVAVCDFVTPTPIGTTWGLGGTCVNVGCIPKKLMHKAAILGRDLCDTEHFGWKLSEEGALVSTSDSLQPSHVLPAKHNWSDMVNEVQKYIKSLNFSYRKTLRKNNVTYLNAYATFIDEHTIQTVDKKEKTETLTGKDFIIAVGGRPNYPDIPGAVEFGITSDDLFSLPYYPGKCLVVGASYVALECAGFLHGIGTDCTVMVRSILLRGFDQQMAEMIGDNMAKLGVKFIRPCVPTRVEKLSDGNPGLYKVYGQMESGEIVEEEYNTVLFAIGRVACTKNLGLEKIGVTVNSKNMKIIVNEMDQSSVGNIYAVGDNADGKPELTPVAIQSGKLLAARVCGKKTLLTDYTNVPTTVFTPLEYGFVGLSEEDAVKMYGEDDIEVYHQFHKPLERALSDKPTDTGYGKLICVKSKQELVVGLHYLGPNAGEVTQGYAIGLKLGAKKVDFDNLIGIHPTSAEIFTTMNTAKSSGASVDVMDC